MDKKKREKKSGSNSEYWHCHRRCCSALPLMLAGRHAIIRSVHIKRTRFVHTTNIIVVIVSSRCDRYNASQSEETNAAVKERKMEKKQPRNKLRTTEYKWILLYNKTHCVRVEPNGLRLNPERERERATSSLHCSREFLCSRRQYNKRTRSVLISIASLPSRSIERHFFSLFSSAVVLLIRCFSVPHTIDWSFLYI